MAKWIATICYIWQHTTDKGKIHCCNPQSIGYINSNSKYSKLKSPKAKSLRIFLKTEDRPLAKGH